MSPDVEIRTARLADVDSLAELHVKAWRFAYTDLAPAEAFAALEVAHRRRHWATLLDRGSEALTLVARVDGRPVGLGHAAPGSHSVMAGAGEVVHLYVDPDCHGRGVGRALFERLAAFLIDSGHTTIRLAVVAGNEPAIRFYEHLGGRSCGSYVDGQLWRSTNLVYEWTMDLR
jgi:ribosomal protein S18 acetylase RimI-like enzyme